MHRLVLSLVIGLAVLSVSPASLSIAAELETTTLKTTTLKTITLAVDKMTCNMCPVTVKKALRKLTGVSEVSAKYVGDGIGFATVTYDPAKVAIEDLTFATEEAGYPSRLKQ